jgi:hypothetical protein
MKQRTSRVLIALVATAALAFGSIGIANASNGADDPPGHISGGHGADDTAQGPAAPGSGSATDTTGKKREKHHRHRRHHGRHGADDGPHHGGHGADDGPNHT